MLIKLEDLKKENLFNTLALNFQYGNGIILRKHNKDSEEKTLKLLNKLKENTIDSRIPIVPITIKPEQLQLMISGKFSDNYNYEERINLYKSIFKTYIQIMGESQLRETKSYAKLVKAAEKNFKNIFDEHYCLSKNTMDDAPIMKDTENIGAKIKALYLNSIDLEQFNNDNKIYHELPYGINLPHEFPRIAFNLTEFPIIEKINFNEWDQQVINTKENKQYPDKANNEEIKKTIISINSFLDGLLNGGEGVPISIAYPGWISDLSQARPYDSKKMNMGNNYGSMMITTEDNIESKQNYII